MGKVQKYEVNINGVTRTLKLSGEDAKRYPGAKRVGDTDERTDAAPRTSKSSREETVAEHLRRAQARTAQARENADQDEVEPTPAKGRTPANKGRTAANK